MDTPTIIMRTSRICLCLLAAIACSLGPGPDLLHARENPPALDTITTKSGLKYTITHRGKGRKPKKGDLVIVHYTGRLMDGTIFDSSRDREPFAFRLGTGMVIQGWDEGLALLTTGSRATFVIPPDLAYGEREVGPIPAHSTLVFDVELLDIKKKSVGDELAKAIDRKGIDFVWKTYNELKKSGFKEVHLSEGELNMLGYQYLRQEKPDEAMAIFQINVDAFPDSFNVYDSLAEAYMARGDRELAIANYERSLELNPDNGNAVEMLKKLNEPATNE